MKDSDAQNIIPAVRLILVAIQDIGWLLIFLPLGVVFQALLLLVRGYHESGRRGKGYRVAYVLFVAGITALVIRRNQTQAREPYES